MSNPLYFELSRLQEENANLKQELASSKAVLDAALRASRKELDDAVAMMVRSQQRETETKAKYNEAMKEITKLNIEIGQTDYRMEQIQSLTFEYFNFKSAIIPVE